MKKKNTIFTKNISFLCLSGLFIIFPIAMYQNTSINEEKTIPRLETITGRIIDFDLGDFSSGITIDTTGDGKANSLYMWGNNQVGQLGLGDNTNYNTPMIVTDLPEGGIIDFSLGETQSGATIDTTGDGKADSLYMWGDNEDGQLGLGSEKTEASYNTPQEVTTLPEGELIDLSFGSNDSGVTIDTTGDGVADTLYMWGYNEYGQLGLGNFVNYDTPQEVTDLPQGGIIDFDLGYHHVGTIIDTTGDGTADSIYMWGANLTGQIGDGTDESSPTPIEIIINSGGSIVDFELGGYDTGVTFDTTADGKADTIYVWGGNFWGELGLGDDQWVFPIPTELNTLPEGEIIDFELGLTHSGAIIDTTGDGVGDALYMWGDNEYGQLGLGSEKPLGWYNSPQNVDLTGIGTPDDLRLGYADSGLTVDTISDGNSDAIYMWGLNEYGELGLGNYSSYGTPQNTEFLIEPPLPLPPSSQDTAIVSDIDTTSATINYSFYPGNDETGNPYEVTDITLSGTGITNNYTVETSSSSVGTITLQDLDPATNYNDLIVHATFNDGNTYEQTVDIFTTRITITAPHPNDIAVVTDIDTTSATINYSFFSGNDETDQPYEVTDITLSGTGITNNYTVESITSPTGTITLQDLDPATNYNDLIVSATFSDGNTYEQTVDIFTTLAISIDPSPNETATVTNVDVTTATINYSFSPGNDENGDPYEVTNITLSGTGITDNYTVESITSQTGTITLQDLGPETNYNDLVVSATFSDANTYNQDVDAFTTLGHTPVVPGPNETATVTDISDTSATINYSFSPGNDINGIPYEVTDITLSGTGITDNYIVESITSPTGTITLQDLDPETNYDDLIVSITFTDGNTYQQDVDSFNTQELYYPSSVNVVKWIIILITLIILIALIVSFSIFLKKIIQNKTMNRIN